MDNKQNKLDDFFRKQLADSSEDHAWNVPQDAVFESAMRSIAAGKKKKDRRWILIPFLLMAVLIGREYIHEGQIKTLEGKITHLEDSLYKESIRSATAPSTSPSIAENSTNINTTTNADADITTSAEHISKTDNKLSTNQNSSKHSSTPVTSPTTRSSTNNTSGHRGVETSKTSPQALSSNTKTNKAFTAPSSANADKTNDVDPSNTSATIMNSVGESSSKGEGMPVDLSGRTAYQGWITYPIAALEFKDLGNELLLVAGFPANPVVSTSNKKPGIPAMRSGILLEANQSWLTMQNITPVPNVSLYDYDNNQPGVGISAFINKPVSSKFSLQTGLGYHVYQNRSILEDQFLYDSDNATQMPNGETMYQTDMNIINPLGDYNTLLEFRVSGQMAENDVMVQYTTIKQTLQCVVLDLGIHYNIFTKKGFSVSLGTGLGLGYRSGIKNDFNVSTYHNDILQKTQTETPDYLNNLQHWYGQAIGNATFEYHPSNGIGYILVAQYNAGLTSLRNDGTSSSPLTYLHAFGLSAGVTHGF